MARCLVFIVDFIFSGCIVDLMGDLNSVFSSKWGNKAYNRSMILGIFLYCFHLHNYNLSDIARECEVNNVLRIFTCGNTPSQAILKRFLENSDNLVLKKVFLYNLVILNDLGLLKFLRAFVDGTDALVNGFKHYILTRDEFKALKLMKKWNLLHNNTLKSKNRVRKKLYSKQKEFENDEEISLLIVLSLRRLDIYNKKIFKRIDEFEKSFSETDKDYICISFPSAVMLPTKKGNYDFGFNLQEIMTEHNIIITGLLLRNPNDNISMDEILSELKENFNLLLELVEKYGCRRNYKEIKKKCWKKPFLFFDSGYYSDKNLELIDKHKIKGLIMPINISKQINNEFRKNNKLFLKEKKSQPPINMVNMILKELKMRIYVNKSIN